MTEASSSESPSGQPAAAGLDVYLPSEAATEAAVKAAAEAKEGGASPQAAPYYHVRSRIAASLAAISDDAVSNRSYQ